MQKFLLTHLFLVFTVVAAAQQIEPFPDSITMNLEKSVVVAGMKPSAALQSTPLMVVTSADFTKLGIHELFEAIKSFNGVQIKDYGGIGGVKTVSVRSMGAQHTAVDYNGITVSNVQSGQIDLGRFSLDNVSRVVMTVGLPDNIFQSARVFASAGVLSITTAEPLFDSKSTNLSASVRYESFGTIGSSVNFEQKLSRKWALAINGDLFGSKGDYPFTLSNGNIVTDERRINSDVKTARGEINLYGGFDDGSKLNIKGNYYNSDRGLPGAVILYNNKAQERLLDKAGFVQAKFEKSFDSDLDLLAQLKISDTFTEHTDKNEVYVGGVQVDTYEQKEYYASAALRWRLNERLSFAIAEDFFLNSMDASLPSFAYPFRRTSLTSLSAQYKTERICVTTNLLSTALNENVKFGEASMSRFRLSPAISVSYRLMNDHNVRLRASYQDIFRTPTFNDLYYAKIGNTKLKPEVARQLNVGLTFADAVSGFADYLSVSADAYYNKVKDKIVAIPSTFISKMLNFGSVDILGVDVSLSADFAAGRKSKLDFTANYSFQSAVDITDSSAKNYKHQIPYTPKHSGNFSLTWSNPWVNVGYNLNLVGERYALPQNIEDNRISGYSEHNVSLSRTFFLKGISLELQAECKNITDCQYEVIKYYPMPGRSFRFSLKLKYL